MKYKKPLLILLFLFLVFALASCDSFVKAVYYIVDGEGSVAMRQVNGQKLEDIKYFIDGKVFKGYFYVCVRKAGYIRFRS